MQWRKGWDALQKCPCLWKRCCRKLNICELYLFYCIFPYVLIKLQQTNWYKKGIPIINSGKREDDSEIECEVLTIFEVEGQDYIALLHDNGEEDGEIFIYRYFEDEDGEPGLDNIETQEEFDMVSEVFDSIVEDGEYDEIIEE